MDVVARVERWPLLRPFRISGNEWTICECIVVELHGHGCTGRGEAMGVSYFGETASRMIASVSAVAREIRAGLDREGLQDLLPAGGARNAIDCAMWDLEAKVRRKSIWELTGIEPSPVNTVFTIGLEDSPEAMARIATDAAHYPLLKVKLNADRPLERLRSIRRARPDARLVVDANQSWTPEILRGVLQECGELDLEMIEQPLPRGMDDMLDSMQSPVLIAADESCQDTGELETCLGGRYGMVNIKLDKTGGLTEALRLATAARKHGCRLMVGNMLGTSLAMAPAFVIAQLCEFVDIDGPLLLSDDRPAAMQYSGAEVSPFTSALWG